MPLFAPPEPIPIGAIFMFPVSVSLPGWLLCNGSSFSSASYPALYALLGGTTLPDLRGLAPMGAGANGIALGVSNANGQAPAHTHNDTGHTHGSAAHSHSDSGHSHSHAHGTNLGGNFLTAGSSNPIGGYASGSSKFASDPSTNTNAQSGSANIQSTTPGNTGTGYASLTGSGSGTANIPPFLGVAFYIKAA